MVQIYHKVIKLILITNHEVISLYSKIIKQGFLLVCLVSMMSISIILIFRRIHAIVAISVKIGHKKQRPPEKSDDLVTLSTSWLMSETKEYLQNTHLPPGKIQNYSAVSGYFDTFYIDMNQSILLSKLTLQVYKKRNMKKNTVL